MYNKTHEVMLEAEIKKLRKEMEKLQRLVKALEDLAIKNHHDIKEIKTFIVM